MRKTRTQFFNKFLALLLCMGILLPLIPTNAFAATRIGTVNGVEYTDIKKLWNAVKKNDNAVVHMSTDWKLVGCLEIPAEHKVTLYMHGHMINRG